MKKILLSLAIATGFISVAFSQIENPVTWSYNAKKVADKVYDLQITATLSPGWHLYSQMPGRLSDPTSFVFANNTFKLK
jgi:thiol:disulfide interchange protein DsbD